MQIKVNSKTRSFGWAYNTIATDGHIDRPTNPMYVGSIKSICKQIKTDSQFQSDRQVLQYTIQWFYHEFPILGIDDGVYSSTDGKDIDTILKSLDMSGATIFFPDPEKKTRGRPRSLPIDYCPRCQSTMRSNGKTKPNKKGQRKQRYKCDSCGYSPTKDGIGHGGARAESFNPPDSPPLTNAQRQRNFRARRKAAAKEML